MSISVILPAINELKNLKLLIPKISYILKNIQNEIIIVDDNSQDGTKKFFQNNYYLKNIKYIRRFKNLGLGQSIAKGMQEAKYDYLIVMDCDFNHNPDDLKKFLNFYYCKTNFFISGSRFVKNGYGNNFFRHYSSYIYSKVIALILKKKISDYLSGFFMIKQKKLKYLKTNKIFYGYGEYYIRLLNIIPKNNIIEVPVIYKKRKFGRSKSNFFKMAINYFIETLKIKLNG